MHGVSDLIGWPSGKGGRYVGEIRRNNPHGEGIKKYPDGTIQRME